MPVSFWLSTHRSLCLCLQWCMLSALAVSQLLHRVAAPWQWRQSTSTSGQLRRVTFRRRRLEAGQAALDFCNKHVSVFIRSYLNLLKYILELTQPTPICMTFDVHAVCACVHAFVHTSYVCILVCIFTSMCNVSPFVVCIRFYPWNPIRLPCSWRRTSSSPAARNRFDNIPLQHTYIRTYVCIYM